MLKLPRDTVRAIAGMSAIVLFVCVLSFAESPNQRSSEESLSYSYAGALPENQKEESFWVRTENDPIALYTAVLALFTIVLACASIYQGWITRRSVDLARDEFNATHRPEIIVHTVRDVPSIAGEPNRNIGAQVSFFNKGRAGARSVAVGAIIIPINGDPEPGIAVPVITDREWSTIAAGRSENFWVSSAIKAAEIAMRQSFNELWGEGTQQVSRVYCIGVIGYADVSGIERQTGFCWEWKGYRWERVTDSSYDYAY